MQADLFDARAALNRVGGNLNQAVAALNATGQATVWLRTVVAMCGRSLSALDEGAIDYLSRELPDVYAAAGTRRFSMVVRSQHEGDQHEGDQVVGSELVCPPRVHE